MLIIPPPKHRRRHRQRITKAVQPLTLVEASFDSGGPFAFLQFDRAIDISSMDPSEIQVGDGVNTLYRYIGTPGGATLEDPTTLRLELTIFGADADGQLTLTATTATGIVASDDGGTWAGVAALPLPYP